MWIWRTKKRFDPRLLNFRSWLQRSLRWRRQRDPKDKSPGDVRGPTPGWTWFSCHVDWVRDLILHLLRCIPVMESNTPVFMCFSCVENELGIESLRNKVKNLWVKFLETEDGFFLISTWSSNFTNWTSVSLPFSPKRGCTWKVLGMRLPLVMILHTFCLNLQLFWSSLTRKLRRPGYKMLN